MINNICEIINQHANENVPRNIWGTFVLRRWWWRLTCQTCDDGRWTQRRPPKPSSWSPSLSCCHKARGRSAGYSRCFPVYRSAISLTYPLSLSSALSSCTPEASCGTFLKDRNDFVTQKGKIQRCKPGSGSFCIVRGRHQQDTTGRQQHQCHRQCCRQHRHLPGNYSRWNCSNPQAGRREKGEAGKKSASP